jgi:hypothetical protein
VNAKRIADWVIYVSVAAFLALSVYLVAVLPVLGTELSKYMTASDAPLCSLQQALSTDGCVAMPTYYVVATGTRPLGLNDFASTITLSPNQDLNDHSIYSVNRPNGVYNELRSGYKVQLKVWNGRATGVSYRGSSFRLYDNPYDLEDLRLYGGIAVGALALVLLAIHPPAVMRRKLARRRSGNAASSETPRSGVAAKLAHDSHMRMALVVFTVAQLLDVATSVHAGRIGFYEGNPVAAMIIERVGWTIALLLLKAIGVIAIILVFARLPRRPALFIAWATSAVFFYVALDNFGLITSAGHPV